MSSTPSDKKKSKSAEEQHLCKRMYEVTTKVLGRKKDVVGGGQDVGVRGVSEGGSSWRRAQQARDVGGCTYPLPGPGSRTSEV